jgi:hypothetical protein
MFALRQILEKCNEFNITTRHLFIDFKAAYDTITRNEIYVIMSLDLPYQTNIKATLTTVKCCGNIQKDCSDPFEMWQGLINAYYQRVLSTLLFNFVLETILRHAKLKRRAPSSTSRHKSSLMSIISILSEGV